MWYWWTEHLSVEHILARHEDPEYMPPYYRDDLSEGRWRKNERKNKVAIDGLRQKAAEEIRIVIAQKQKTLQRVAQVLSWVQQKMQENFQDGVITLCEAIRLVRQKKEKTQEILEQQKLQLRTQSAIRNTKQGLWALAVSQLKPWEMDEVGSQFLMIHLLDLQMKVKKERRKAVRKNMEQLQESYRKELQWRGISTEKIDLEKFVYGLAPEERRKILSENQ
jgi:hypothetical protein